MWYDRWGFKFNKLHSFLVSSSLYVDFPILSTSVLEKKLLDHRLIVLLQHDVDNNTYLFCLCHSLLNMDGFDEVLKALWTISVDGLGYPWVRFKNNLQILKHNM